MSNLELSPTQASVARRAGGLAALAIPAVLAVLAAAVVLRQNLPFAADVSWLLTVGEQMSAGKVLYRDLFEVNPPASVMLYLPCLALARMVGITPEFAVQLLTFGLAAVSTLLSRRILQQDGREGTLWTSAMVLAIFLILPAYVFAQREHIAAMSVLPMLAAFAARRVGVAPSLPAALLAGLLAGVGIAIKPYFALALLLPATYVLATTLGPRLRAVVNIENISALAVVVAYVLAVLVCFPDFITTMLPIVLALYTPARTPLFALLLGTGPALWFAALASQRLLIPQRFRDPENLILALASLGFLLAALVQGKGWPYHTYPAVALALIAAARGIALPTDVRRAPQSASTGVSIAFGAFMAVIAIEAVAAYDFFGDRFYPVEAIAAARQLSPPQPKVLLIGHDLSVGHPLVRMIGGRWVDFACNRWLTRGAADLLKRADLSTEERTRIETLAALDRSMLLAAIRDRVPDLILIHGDVWRDWAHSDPDISAALVPYREGARVNNISLMLRRSRDDAAPVAAGDPG